MKQGILVFAAVCIGIGSTTSLARADVRQGEYIFGPYGLYSLPLDDYPSPRFNDVPFIDMGSDVKSQPGLSGAVDWVMRPNFSIGAEFKAYFGDVDASLLQDFLDYHVKELNGIEATWRTIHIGARGRYYWNPDKEISPFLNFGLGLYVNQLREEFRQTRGSGSSNEYFRSEAYTSPGVSVGPGLLMRISSVTRVSIDASLTNVFTADRNVRYLAVSLGLVFGVVPE